MVNLMECGISEFLNKTSGRKLICFGAGVILYKFCLQNPGVENKIFCIIDNNKNLSGTYKKINGISLKILTVHEFLDLKINDFVIMITNQSFVDEILNQLNDTTEFNGIDCTVAVLDNNYNETVLHKLQSVELEILDIAVGICEKYNLRYYLDGGTLLGAVRHKGFIPWDDDIDISLPRKDYNKFLKICKNELPGDYFLHCSKSDKTYWMKYAKIKKNNTLFNEERFKNLKVHKGIFIDIFPIDNASREHSKFISFQKNFIIKLEDIIFYKRGIKFCAHPKNKLLSLFPITFLIKIRDAVMSMNLNNNSEYYYRISSAARSRILTVPKTVYGEGIPVEFEGKTYRAPDNTDYYLSRLYGTDYMEFPPFYKRVTHAPAELSFDLKSGEYEIKQNDNTLEWN